jgi:transcription elongation GreA/GreB family factor
MSRAFVKDDDGGEGGEDLPDRLISHHRNLVTAHGLAQIEAEVERLSADYAHAQSDADRMALQKVARDLRYWTARRATAEAVDRPDSSKIVEFGATVTIQRADGRKQTWTIVGEDEADPTKGTLSYVSPLAQALMGKSVGDSVKTGAGQAEIVKIGRVSQT